MAKAPTQPSAAVMNQLNADKLRTDKILAQHRARLKEIEAYDPMIWGREIARARRAISRAEARLEEIKRLFSAIS